MAPRMRCPNESTGPWHHISREPFRRLRRRCNMAHPADVQPANSSRTAVVFVVFLLLLVTGGWLLARGTHGETQTVEEGIHLFHEVERQVAEEYVDSIP